MHCPRPPLGPIQGDARVRRTCTAPYPHWIHGHQAHLCHGSKPFDPHRDGPDRTDRSA